MLPSNEVRQGPAACDAYALQTPASLANAFDRFGRVASSLEHSYKSLRSEVTTLRRELRSKNEELMDARRDVQRMEALAELSAELAHQIRNPLAALELQIGLLLQCGELREETLRWSEQLQAGIRALTAVTNNVLHFHSVVSGAREPIPIENLLSDTEAFLEPLARQARVNMAFEDRALGSRIEGNRQQLQQALVNIALVSFSSIKTGELFRIAADRDSATSPVLTPRTDELMPGVSLREAERKLLQVTLQATDGNRTKAAQLMGVSLRTVRNKIRDYGLPPRRFA